MRLLKTLVILLLVMGLALGAALPASADSGSPSSQGKDSVQVDKGQPDKDRGPWADGKVNVIRGKVDSVSVSDNVIRVDGKTIIVSGTTAYKVPGLDKKATLSDIKAGMQIVALCSEKDGKTYARQITVVPSRPSYGHHVGQVVAYHPGDNITIRDKWNNTVTFKIGENFKILPAGATVKVGDEVTVITRGHLLTGDRIAVGVVVHQKAPSPGPGPGLGFQSITGNITSMNATSLTIDGTVLSYNATTIFVVRGISGVPIGTGYGFSLTGHEATVFYRQQGDTKLAKVVLIGINLPQALKEIGSGKLEDQEED